jgi:hypothetical protein
MTDSSLPAVVDKLVTDLATRPAYTTRDAKIFDGYPDSEPPLFAVIGGAITPLTVADVAVQTIGQPEQDAETYVVDVEFHSATGDVDQKTPRDNVFALYNDLRAYVKADPSLGGLVTGTVRVTNWSLTQTNADEAPDGRTAVLTCGVRVEHWLTG